MVENISEQQNYINYVMNKLPYVRRGDVHILQKGDNLWNLAKKALNKDKASNREISEYMLLIAKLNDLDTVEKMNSLKISDKIYMPETLSKNITSDVQNEINEKRLTSAERSILALKDVILNDKTVFTEMAYPRSINLYHVYNNYTNSETGYNSPKHPLITFKLDKNGNVKTVSYNDEKPLRKIKYDYDMDAKGNIIIDDYVRQTKVGQLDKEEVAEIHKILKDFARQAKLSY